MLRLRDGVQLELQSEERSLCIYFNKLASALMFRAWLAEKQGEDGTSYSECVPLTAGVFGCAIYCCGMQQ